MAAKSDPRAREDYDRQRRLGDRPEPESPGDGWSGDSGSDGWRPVYEDADGPDGFACADDSSGPEHGDPRWEAAGADQRADERNPGFGSAPYPQGRTVLSAQTYLARHPSFVLFVAAFLVFEGVVALRASGLVFLSSIVYVAGVSGVVRHARAERLENAGRAEISTVDEMDGVKFEMFLVSGFRRAGYAVRQTGHGGHDSADLLLRHGGESTAVRGTCSDHPVGVAAVRIADAARSHAAATKALVVTNSFFTPAATNLARSRQVALWDRAALAEFIASTGDSPRPSVPAFLWAEIKEGLPATLRLPGASTLTLGTIFRVVLRVVVLLPVVSVLMAFAPAVLNSIALVVLLRRSSVRAHTASHVRRHRPTRVW